MDGVMALSQDDREIRAEQARQLLDNPLLNEVLSRIDAEAVEDVRRAPLHDIDVMRAAVMEVQAVDVIRRKLRAYADAPKFAKASSPAVA